MKQPRDLALRFLQLANRDIGTLIVLARAEEVDDEPIGFHAQQAVEKCLKAALAMHRVAFRKTHDLSELLDLMDEHGVPKPPFADSLDELNPYGVLLRYEWGDSAPLDRPQVQEIATTVRDWATRLIS